MMAQLKCGICHRDKQRQAERRSEWACSTAAELELNSSENHTFVKQNLVAATGHGQWTKFSYGMIWAHWSIIALNKMSRNFAWKLSENETISHS